MTFLDEVASIIRLGGCVVMGIGVVPEKFHMLLQGATSPDYMVIGAKNSEDANFIASKISGEVVEPRSETMLGIEMNIYFVSGEKVKS